MPREESLLTDESLQTAAERCMRRAASHTLAVTELEKAHAEENAALADTQTEEKNTLAETQKGELEALAKEAMREDSEDPKRLTLSSKGS